MKKIEKSIELGGRKLTLTTGVLAEQAQGAVMARYGDTVVLATVGVADLSAELDYFPLSVDYQEKLYAGGRIKGSRWVKREGRPTDDEILSGRLIDRSLRPLFPKTYRKEVQVIVTVMSVDNENDPRLAGAVAASAAVHLTDLPWKGPVGTIMVGKKDGKLVVNPTNGDKEGSDMELFVSSTSDAVLMIEAGANEVSEKDIVDGVKLSKKESTKLIKLIEDLAKEKDVKREVYKEEKPSVELERAVKKLVDKEIPALVKSMATHEGASGDFREFVEGVKDHFDDEDEKRQVLGIIDHIKKDYIRENILKKGVRPDGRKLTEVRPLSTEIGFLPRTHGSGFFKRGQTHVLTVATIGPLSLGQLLESAEGEEEKRYMHHYSMPPYASGETGRIGSPKRREIGHGALAERALFPVIPSEEEFPYAIRLVSEVMSSNGSTSMGSVCGSTLSLMDAGVPIKAPVAGIAMGVIVEGKNAVILSDIMGVEDFNGDMDFKVAGTDAGITALQLDVKTLDLTPEMLEKALEQAKAGRATIMKSITDTISSPKKSVSKYAPKIKMIKIAVDRIGEFVGPGGKNIKKLIADTGAEIEVDDDGSVSISSTDEESIEKAYAWVEGFNKDPKAGEIYDGEVKRLLNFGAFVEILPGKEGLVHVSDMSADFVKDPADVVSVGDKVTVRVKEIDEMGRINLSMNLDPAVDKQKEEKRKESYSGGDRSGGRRDYGGRGRRYNDNRGRSNSRGGYQRRDSSGGPHFPTSRLMQDASKGRR